MASICGVGYRGLRGKKFLGLMLRANAQARAAYARHAKMPRVSWSLAGTSTCKVDEYDALRAAGRPLGARHARNTSRTLHLQGFVGDFFDAGKPVAAICHGVVLAARSLSKRTGKSVCTGRKRRRSPGSSEKSAWSMMKFLRAHLGPGLLPHLYRGGRESRRASAVSRPRSAGRWRRPMISWTFREAPRIILER